VFKQITNYKYLRYLLNFSVAPSLVNDNTKMYCSVPIRNRNRNAFKNFFILPVFLRFNIFLTNKTSFLETLINTTCFVIAFSLHSLSHSLASYLSFFLFAISLSPLPAPHSRSGSVFLCSYLSSSKRLSLHQTHFLSLALSRSLSLSLSVSLSLSFTYNLTFK
jgi:hypothetical protein